MSFIGTQPGYAYSTITKDTFNGDDSTTAFTLSTPATTNGVEVFVENVQQEPTTAYTVSGTTLTFTSAPVTGTGNIYVVHRNPTVQTVVPPSGVALSPSTVTATGDISTEGDLKVEVASGGIYTVTGTDTATNRTLTLPDEAGTVLSSGTPLSSFPSGFANGITEADSWRINTTTSAANGAVIATNWEQVDTDGFAVLGTGLSQSSGVFTFPSTGYWWINFFAEGNRTNANTQYICMVLQYTSNNSSYSDAVESRSTVPTTNYRSNSSGTFMFKITDTSNHKFRFVMDTAAGSGTEFIGATDRSATGFSTFKVAEV
jgi:hypothetical protein